MDQDQQQHPFPQNDGLPFPPDLKPDPYRGGKDMPPAGHFWIYTCPKCGGKMYAPEVWCGVVVPIICANCGYTIQGESELTVIT